MTTAWPVADVPPEVADAIAASGVPFDPVGTLSMRHPKPSLPAIVLIVRRGRKWIDLANGALSAHAAGANLFLTFEDETEFEIVKRAFGGRR